MTLISILGLLLVSFTISSLLIVPFINGLYKLRFLRLKQETKDAFGAKTPIFDSLHKHKAGTPVGGGLLIISVVSILFALIFPILKYLNITVTNVYPLRDEIIVLFFTFLSFGLLGLYDDVRKFFGVAERHFFGLRMWHKLLIQIVLALVAALMLYLSLKIDILYVPFFGVIHLGMLFVPFATLVIVGFANAVNITDGLDGLASGVLMISLFAFWVISASILDTPLSMFLALWIGAIIAFLYSPSNRIFV